MNRFAFWESEISWYTGKNIPTKIIVMIKDNRNKYLQQLEAEIQKRSKKKDRHFVLSGPWKKFVRNQDGLKIYAVNGTWIRNNLCIFFGHGGHGLVHEFIPNDEIWVSTHHYHESNWDEGHCDCKVRTHNQRVSKNYFESTVVHEIFENKLMGKGKSYWAAHNAALKKELEAGWLADPYDDQRSIKQ